MSETKQLPWVCPDHPDAQIRHEWDRTQSSHVLNGETRRDATFRLLRRWCLRRWGAQKESRIS